LDYGSKSAILELINHILIYDKCQTIRIESMGRDEISESGQEFHDGEGACPVFGHVRFSQLRAADL
jgi:hypothetical protein